MCNPPTSTDVVINILTKLEMLQAMVLNIWNTCQAQMGAQISLWKSCHRNFDCKKSFKLYQTLWKQPNALKPPLRNTTTATFDLSLSIEVEQHSTQLHPLPWIFDALLYPFIVLQIPLNVQSDWCNTDIAMLVLSTHNLVDWVTTAHVANMWSMWPTSKPRIHEPNETSSLA